MALYYLDTQTRNASGAEADLLVSQGWTLMPDPPAYDPVTQAPPEWNKSTHVWDVRNLNEDELLAVTLSEKRAALTNEIVNLRAWSQDAKNAVAAWDGQATAQRFAVLKVVVTRLGIFFDKFADMIETK